MINFWLRATLAMAMLRLGQFSAGAIVAAGEHHCQSQVKPSPIADDNEAEYSVEYRHPEATGGHWRVACAWTTDYDYAVYIYYHMAKLGYEVRFYVR